jgi:molybdopterin-dependent oxidoreductase alpha subunit
MARATDGVMSESDVTIRIYRRPAGGWGALRATGKSLLKHGAWRGAATLLQANQPGGFDCPGCAWPDSPRAKRFAFCENGAKAIAHEATAARANAEFFAAHPLSVLREQSDLWLEAQGRLTEPMRYDPVSDTYRPLPWNQAFALAGEALRQLPDPNRAVFYTSGRASNEAAFLYQLFVRAYGTNNLPDSSNLCHEPSGVALREVIGVGKGTIELDDFTRADAIFIFGQNPGSNHPRMLGELAHAHKRGAVIVAFNPLRERGLERFTDPQSPSAMLTGGAETIADHYFQVKTGGDLAALKGMIRALLEADAAARAAGLPGIVDDAFIAAHTTGFEALVADVLAEPWSHIEAESGLTKAQLESAARLYANANAVLATWCMGITQHEYAVPTIQMIVNLLLLRGNIGKPGAGLMPVRGHSNVQGDRTMGITAKPPALWLDALEREFGIAAPRAPGHDAYGTIHALLAGEIDAFIALGGNFAAAAPESARVLQAMSRCALTAHVATKLNRSHLYPGRIGLLLPCLGRTEADLQAGGRQFVTVEDSMSMVHASSGDNRPASEALRSEPAIVAALAAATLPSSTIDWHGFGADYDRIRDAIERTADGVIEGFEHFNRRVRTPHGFRLPNAAAERRWLNAGGKAEFRAHSIPVDTAVQRARLRHGERVLSLMTIRSHDQYNTTVYSLDDRYRGVVNGRHVVFISAHDLARLGFSDGEWVDLVAADDAERRVKRFRLVEYDLPPGCIAAYFPEATPLASLELRARGANTPAMKEIPVLIERRPNDDGHHANRT